MPEVVRFYGLWKRLLAPPNIQRRYSDEFSAKVGEENERILKHGVPPKPPPRQFLSREEASHGQHVGLSDDEGSIIAQPSKPPSCAACRTRDSATWWKAPKGLATNIMCDTCGSNWRKYADLVVRPVRDESVISGKSRMGEKREGSPLSGPLIKRSRVSTTEE